LKIRELAWYESATWVTTRGQVLRHPLRPLGLVVFDEEGRYPIVAFDEVADDAVVDVFMTFDRPPVESNLKYAPVMAGTHCYEVIVDKG